MISEDARERFRAAVAEATSRGYVAPMPVELRISDVLAISRALDQIGSDVIESKTGKERVP